MQLGLEIVEKILPVDREVFLGPLGNIGPNEKIVQIAYVSGQKVDATQLLYDEPPQMINLVQGFLDLGFGWQEIGLGQGR